MEFDSVFLSRLQFAWVIGWHFLLPAFTVGAAAFITVLEGINLATGRDIYLPVSMFWIRIFSISFGMGVVTGVVMPFQLGTNWSRYSDATANVLSPLFAYEDLMAFFLEAAFLGVLLFGRKLVPPWAHSARKIRGGRSHHAVDDAVAADRASPAAFSRPKEICRKPRAVRAASA